ncbi:MAG: hypothetical protein QOD41_1048 [Cryptosporangiaceae bacterium]|nr:hypothetical protein [Cryptosporangiaceae bacterium]
MKVLERPLLRVLAVAAVVIPAAALLMPADPAVAAAPPAGAAVQSVSGFGSGCTSDSVTATWDDASQFKVTYGSFGARAGGDSGPLDFVKACSLSVQLTIPDGYSVALAGAKSLLYADVADGATVTHRTRAYWQGMSAENRWTKAQRGPFQDSWISTANTDPAALIYSTCGENRRLQITTNLTVSRGSSNPATQSSVEYDNSWGGANGVYQLVWKACG